MKMNKDVGRRIKFYLFNSNIDFLSLFIKNLIIIYIKYLIIFIK